MDYKTDNKRKMDKQNDNEDRRREKKSRRHRSRSRSYEDRDRRKRRHSRSRSPNVPVKQERRRDDAPNEPVQKAPERKAKETDMLNTRTGGAYIPPARLRMMQAQITDKSSVAYQRLAWEALKKSIHGHINKINVGNIGIIIKELLKENIVRGRGLLCRSVIQAQAASPTFTNVYAALVAAVNSRFPNIGELLLKRLVIQFKRGFKRNDKPTCISSASFIAHLVNQRVAHEILALELLTLLVESPTDDSVEVAIAFLKECGQKLTEVSSKGVNAIFEMLRNILHEGQLDKRVQYMIEVMFQVWKDGFKDHPALIEELELVPEEDQFTHLLMLDDATDPQDILNVFKFDEKYEDNEQKYKTLSKEILGSDAESGEEDGSEESGSEESDDEEEQEGEQKGMTIIDNTETNLVALRRTIYLTINSSLDFEECAHKLMKMQLKPGQEVELCHMFLDCCAEQRTYEKFYGLLAQRFCNINRMYIGPFEEIFKDSYGTAHRLDTNRLRNVSKFFAHLLFTDSISWEVLECVKLNEEDTTSSSRIYIKILFQELAEYMGLKKLNDRLRDPTLQEAFSGIFPRDNPKNTRFSINFFTSIGLGGLTDELREHLKQMPKNVPAAVTNINVESDSSSDSSSSSSSSDSSSSDSSSSDSEDSEKKKKSKKSKEKEKSKTSSKSTNEDTANKENKDKDKRWGHDGFYDTYGDQARRHEERPEQNRDNFARPRDISRRYEDKEKQKEWRENTDSRNNWDSDRRRNERDTRETEESRGIREEIDNHRRPERGHAQERRRHNVEDRRNEYNSNNDNRYDNERSTKDYSDRYDRRNNGDNRSRRDDREDKIYNKDRRRDQRHDEYSTNRTDRIDNRNRDNSKKDNRDKDVDRNDRQTADNDRLRNKNYKDISHEKTKDKRESRATEVRDSRENRNDMDKKDKYNDASNRDASKNRYKEDRNKNNRKDNDDIRHEETEERNRRDDKSKSNKDKIDNSKNAKDKMKENNHEKRVHKENSSQEESDSEREEKNKDRKYKNKKSKVDSEDRTSKKRKNKKRQSSSEESENDSSDSNSKVKRSKRKTEKSKQQENKSKNNKDSKDGDDSKKKNKEKKHNKHKENSSESSDDSDSSSSSDSSESSDENNKTTTRYWDTFDIGSKKNAQERDTKQKLKNSDRKRER